MSAKAKDLARLTPVDLREIWENETADFTPWLAEPENLRLLGETLGMELEDARTEEAVGSFSADMVATHTADNSRVLIENQLEKTNHGHLGQILTYAAGLDARTVIWIAKNFTDEHRAALDWLNNHTSSEIGFFGLEIEVWKIGDSPSAPKFNIAAKPNEWTKALPAKRELTPTQRTQLDFWSGFRDYATANAAKISPTAALPQNWMRMSIGRTGFGLQAIASIGDWDGRNSPEIRAEFLIFGKDAKQHFKRLRDDGSDINTSFAQAPNWYSEAGVQQCKIVFRKAAEWRDRAVRQECYEWLVKNLDRLHEVFQPRILKLP